MMQPMNTAFISQSLLASISFVYSRFFCSMDKSSRHCRANRGLVLLFCISASASAKEWTWNELRKVASEGGLALDRYAIEVRAAKAQASLASAGFYPTLRANLSKTRQFDPVPVGVRDTNLLTVTASQNLFSGFSDHYAAKAAAASLEIQDHQGKITNINQRKLLRRLFDKVIYYQDAMKAAKKTLARRLQNVRIVSLRYESGRENKSALLKTEAFAEEAKQEVSTLELSLGTSIFEINQILRVASVGTTDSFVPDERGSHLATDVDVSKHPEVRATEGRIVKSSFDLMAQRDSWMPQVNADASFSRSGDNLSLDPKNRYSVGLSVSMLIFDPKRSARYRELSEAVALASVDSAITIQRIEAEVKASEERLKASQSQLVIARKLMEAASLQSEVYRQRYTLGMISFQDWDLAESEHIKSEWEVLQAVRDINIALTELEAVRGVSLEDKL